MAFILFFIYLVALPIIAIVVGISILFYGAIKIFPVIFMFFALMVLVGLLCKPFEPIIRKYRSQLNTIRKWIGIILFGPLITFIIGTIIALPFVMIYSLSENPLLWFSLIGVFILWCIFNFRREVAQ